MPSAFQRAVAVTETALLSAGACLILSASLVATAALFMPLPYVPTLNVVLGLAAWLWPVTLLGLAIRSLTRPASPSDMSHLRRWASAYPEVRIALDQCLLRHVTLSAREARILKKLAERSYWDREWARQRARLGSDR